MDPEVGLNADGEVILDEDGAPMLGCCCCEIGCCLDDACVTKPPLECLAAGGIPYASHVYFGGGYDEGRVCCDAPNADECQDLINEFGVCADDEECVPEECTYDIPPPPAQVYPDKCCCFCAIETPLTLDVHLPEITFVPPATLPTYNPATCPSSQTCAEAFINFWGGLIASSFGSGAVTMTRVTSPLAGGSTYHSPCLFRGTKWTVASFDSPNCKPPYTPPGGCVCATEINRVSIGAELRLCGDEVNPAGLTITAAYVCNSFFLGVDLGISLFFPIGNCDEGVSFTLDPDDLGDRYTLAIPGVGGITVEE